MTHSSPQLGPVERELVTARRHFLEPYGVQVVTSSYLKVAVIALFFVSLGLIYLNLRTLQRYKPQPPTVVRIDQAGRAEAINYGSFEYRPQDPEVRYFLRQFVQQYFGRRRATIRSDYPTSLYFLDADFAESIIGRNRKEGVVERFLQSGEDDVDIQVINVAIEDLRTSPYRAVVEFEKIYLTPTRSEKNRKRFTSHVTFVVRQPVPNALVAFNPLGLTITYFRVDEAF